MVSSSYQRHSSLSLSYLFLPFPILALPTSLTLLSCGHLLRHLQSFKSASSLPWEFSTYSTSQHKWLTWRPYSLTHNFLCPLFKETSHQSHRLQFWQVVIAGIQSAKASVVSDFPPSTKAAIAVTLTLVAGWSFAIHFSQSQSPNAGMSVSRQLILFSMRHWAWAHQDSISK